MSNDNDKHSQPPKEHEPDIAVARASGVEQQQRPAHCDDLPIDQLPDGPGPGSGRALAVERAPRVAMNLGFALAQAKTDAEDAGNGDEVRRLETLGKRGPFMRAVERIALRDPSQHERLISEFIAPPAGTSQKSPLRRPRKNSGPKSHRAEMRAILTRLLGGGASFKDKTEAYDAVIREADARYSDRGWHYDSFCRHCGDML